MCHARGHGHIEIPSHISSYFGATCRLRPAEQSERFQHLIRYARPWTLTLYGHDMAVPQKFRPCIKHDVSATHEYRTPIRRRWFILYGLTVADVRHDKFTLMMTVWATTIAVVAVATWRGGQTSAARGQRASFMLSCVKIAGATSPLGSS